MTAAVITVARHSRLAPGSRLTPEACPGRQCAAVPGAVALRRVGMIGSIERHRSCERQPPSRGFGVAAYCHRDPAEACCGKQRRNLGVTVLEPVAEFGELHLTHAGYVLFQLVSQREVSVSAARRPNGGQLRDRVVEESTRRASRR
jgi:hypothetical protein